MEMLYLVVPGPITFPPHYPIFLKIIQFIIKYLIISYLINCYHFSGLYCGLLCKKNAKKWVKVVESG
ncbi:MAG: hypothetical protein DYG99_15255 [Bacteroidetes bacterium CHB5]|nr:hypothetical protein [Bacteroidetes bacterium CHB5]